MNNQQLIDWLLEGDVSIQYQTHRDLLDKERADLQDRILKEGWGAQFMSMQKSDGHWGQKFYFPKWISTHYTLLDIRNLCPSPNIPEITRIIDGVALYEKSKDGGIALSGETQYSDVCVNAMFLNYASYFCTEEELVTSIVDMILGEYMKDGGFNCRSNRSGAKHSSLHTTLSVLEGFTEYEKNGYQYRIKEVQHAIQTSVEFILLHRLFLSDRTGKIIDQRFLRLSYPWRWRFDILRALDYFQYAKVPWNDRMQPAMDILMKKRNKDGTWNVQAKLPGELHFEMEKAGKPSRWNTLRALRVLNHFGIEI